MLTYTGKCIDVLNFQPQDICIEDIAHSLSMICRYVGHVRFFFSVAYHSVLVSELCTPQQKLAALLHDASEAYLSDIASPLKETPVFAEYRALEYKIQSMINKVFGAYVSETDRDEIMNYDINIRLVEMKQLLPYASKVLNTDDIPPQYENIKIRAYSPEESEQLFLAKFNELV